MPLPKPEKLELYRALVESSPDLILIADWESARFVDANAAALRELGYSMVELNGMTGGDLSQFPREEHRRVSQELIELGATRVHAVPIRRKDGSLLQRDLWVTKFVAAGTTYSATVMRSPAGLSDVDDRFRVA